VLAKALQDAANPELGGTMIRLTLRYAKYALIMLAAVGFGTSMQ